MLRKIPIREQFSGAWTIAKVFVEIQIISVKLLGTKTKRSGKET